MLLGVPNTLIAVMVAGGLVAGCGSADSPAMALVPATQAEAQAEAATDVITSTAGPIVLRSKVNLHLADRAVLANFRDAVFEGAPLVSSGEENLGTLAAISAASRSRRERRAFDPRELLAEARDPTSSALRT